ncbi:AT-hook motif nuclear-localized protein 1 isoform X2 [Lotus japonicus]|uniref:AT-hook motif nuclear-localized protein 1 isoform X2 n=1 Tax=Lotus japonicus TaxID=34305 RepID=UPI00258D82B7|nr:AT-hook motif nuclear-localized protein 1 isoform X2 [Lotus japonicus]XP_057449878.1 AT-hook motif nuclear-localized protein 1 isoform X2 [Lotus japonicus]XP_057449879.1 AT-hook motif nuclear-localized protein 1 isoform X2 [Lotus japonicus]
MFTNRFSPHCTSDGALTQFDKAPPPEMNHSSQSERAAGSFMFTPHIININSGEDVFRKIMLFCQQSPRAICIHSAEGRISTVTISHVDSSATVTYEGSFEIMALSGGFFPQESVGGTLIRSGRMNISCGISKG